MGKVLTGLFVGVFVGAVAYEVLKKTEITQKTARKVSEGLKSAKKAFGEGYRSTTQRLPVSD
jgi:uncharacterized membrane-anchored protein YhcB (DUF1043 family)